MMSEEPLQESEAAARSTHSERLVQFCTTDKGKLSMEFGLLDEMIKELEKNNTSSLCILKTMYGSSTACKDSEVYVFDNRQCKEMQGCNNIYTRLIDKLRHCYRWDVSSMLSILMLSVNSESCLNLIKSFTVKVNSKMKLQQIYEHCKLKGFEIPEQFHKVSAIEDGKIFSNITLEKYHVLKCFVSALYGMEDYVMSSFIKASSSLFVRSSNGGKRNPEVLSAKEVIIQDQEECPFKDGIITSKQFTCDGGVIVFDHYGVKVTVPEGAIEDVPVEIQVSASLFGPFDIPSGCHPVSPYVWIAANYKFKKQLQVDFQHHADVSSIKDTSKLCILKACCSRGTHHHMTEWNCHRDISDTVCTLFTNHFCSYCAASKSDKIPDRIVAYLYLPEGYESADKFRAETCFCYDLSTCKKRTEERYEERKMIKVYYPPLTISLIQMDELHISEPSVVYGWIIAHLGLTMV